MEEERRWKKEGEGGIRRGIEWLKGRILGESILEINFVEEGRKEGAGAEGKKTGGGG